MKIKSLVQTVALSAVASLESGVLKWKRKSLLLYFLK